MGQKNSHIIGVHCSDFSLSEHTLVITAQAKKRTFLGCPEAPPTRSQYLSQS